MPKSKKGVRLSLGADKRKSNNESPAQRRRERVVFTLFGVPRPLTRASGFNFALKLHGFSVDFLLGF